MLIAIDREKRNLLDVNLKTGEVKEFSLPEGLVNPRIASIQHFGAQDKLTDTFPYMIATGKNASLLLNMNKHEAQVLMTTVPDVRDARKALQFFDDLDPTLDETTGKPKQASLRCIYATQMLGFQSTRVYQVHEMTFFNDFLCVLHKYGQILDVSLENVKRLESEVH